MSTKISLDSLIKGCNQQLESYAIPNTSPLYNEYCQVCQKAREIIGKLPMADQKTEMIDSLHKLMTWHTKIVAYDPSQEFYKEILPTFKKGITTFISKCICNL